LSETYNLRTKTLIFSYFSSCFRKCNCDCGSDIE